MNEHQDNPLFVEPPESGEDSLPENNRPSPDNPPLVTPPPPPRLLFPSRKKLIVRFLADFMIAILIGVALFLPLMVWIRGTDYELLFGAFFTQLGLLYVFIRRYRHFKAIHLPMLPLFEGPTLPALRWGLIVGIVLFALNVLHGIILEDFLNLDVTENNPWLEIQDYSKLAVYGTLLVGGVMAPVVEEFLLRGLMFGTFVASGYKKTGTVFTVLLFIALHLDPYNTIAYAMLGLGFLWVYYRTRNLLSAILAHFINNALGFLFILLPFE